jgi:LacI family transcriptional regulator
MKRTKNAQVTIAQVAREAGVSTQTVSRVINNRQELSPETRQRVQAVIDRMRYQPNAIARSLSQRRSHTLGVAVSGIEYYGPSHTLIGIDQAANRLGFSIILNLIHQPEDGDIEQVFQNLISRQVEGIIWAVPEIGNNRAWLRKEVQRHATPFIFTDMQSEKKFNTISVDNYAGGKLASGHLLSAGYRKIGLITGPQNWLSAGERRRGWQDALAAAGCPSEARQVAGGTWTAESGERGLLQLLDTFPEMEAVFVSNDQMAFGVYQALARLGKRVPEDLAVVGFDDIPESAYFCPPLTTVRQDLYEVGNLAVQAFVNAREAEQNGKSSFEGQNLVLQPQLIVRQSSISANRERSQLANGVS